MLSLLAIASCAERGTRDVYRSKVSGAEPPARSGEPVVGATQDVARAPAARAYRVVGRSSPDAGGGVRFAWSGSRVEARFYGTALDVVLEDPGSNAFEVVLDGAGIARILAEPGVRTYHAVTGAPPGEHTVAIVKRTEAMVGEAVFRGFVTPEGSRFLGATTPRKRSIELVGDSITAALGAEGDDPCTPPRLSQDSFRSYGEIAARALDADVVNLSWSGVRAAGPAPTMADLYPLALPRDPTTVVNVPDPAPDAVVVNLGDNDDFWSPGAADRFHEDYVRFVRSLRARYPEALVLCTTGPMGTGSSEAARRTIARAVRTLSDPRIFYLEFSPIDAAKEGLGCGSHPTLKTHARMAETLRAELAKHLGW